MDNLIPPQSPTDEPESLLDTIVRLYEAERLPQTVIDEQLGPAKVYELGSESNRMFILIPIPEENAEKPVPQKKVVYSRRSHLRPRKTYWQIDAFNDDTLRVIAVINGRPNMSEEHKEEIVELADELMREFVASL